MNQSNKNNSFISSMFRTVLFLTVIACSSKEQRTAKDEGGNEKPSLESHFVLNFTDESIDGKAVLRGKDLTVQFKIPQDIEINKFDIYLNDGSTKIPLHLICSLTKTLEVIHCSTDPKFIENEGRSAFIDDGLYSISFDFWEAPNLDELKIIRLSINSNIGETQALINFSSEEPSDYLIFR